jgi:hypothetical protein
MASIEKHKARFVAHGTTFLNGVIEEEVYVEQPQGFETHDMQSHVCRLKKSLY